MRWGDIFRCRSWGQCCAAVRAASCSRSVTPVLLIDTGTEQQIIAAQRPAHPLGKCIASVQLLAYILVSKYADALPLYRLEHILKRYGGAITRTTMANWIIRLDDVFRPLINLMREH